jgi:hypothetical protein
MKTLGLWVRVRTRVEVRVGGKERVAEAMDVSVCELNNKKGGRDEAIFSSSCPKVSDG